MLTMRHSILMDARISFALGETNFMGKYNALLGGYARSGCRQTGEHRSKNNPRGAEKMTNSSRNTLVPSRALYPQLGICQLHIE